MFRSLNRLSVTLAILVAMLAGGCDPGVAPTPLPTPAAAITAYRALIVAGVEPTNNDAERPLRRAVLWRRDRESIRRPGGDRGHHLLTSLRH